jgi:hypothetical protein
MPGVSVFLMMRFLRKVSTHPNPSKGRVREVVINQEAD